MLGPLQPASSTPRNSQVWRLMAYSFLADIGGGGLDGDGDGFAVGDPEQVADLEPFEPFGVADPDRREGVVGPAQRDRALHLVDGEDLGGPGHLAADLPLRLLAGVGLIDDDV